MSNNGDGAAAVQQGTEGGTVPTTGNQRRRNPRYRGKRGTTNPATASSGFKGGIESIQNHVFIHSQINNNKWITARREFIDYASKKYDGNVESSLENKELMIITADKPIPPTKEEMDKLSDDLYKEFRKREYYDEMKRYNDVVQKTKDSLTKLYRDLWSQCDPTMKNKVMAQAGYAEADQRKSVIKLLILIETVCEQGDMSKHKTIQKFLCLKKLINFRQHDEMDIGEYLQKFKALVGVAERAGCCLYDIHDLEYAAEGMVPDKRSSDDDSSDRWSEYSPESRETIKTRARDQALGIMFLMNANEKRYAIYRQDLHNNMAKGRNEYPRTLIEARTLLWQQQ